MPWMVGSVNSLFVSLHLRFTPDETKLAISTEFSSLYSWLQRLLFDSAGWQGYIMSFGFLVSHVWFLRIDTRQVMRYSGSPHPHHQKMAARDPGDEKPPPGSRAALIFLADFFRISLDGLSERWTTRSLHGAWWERAVWRRLKTTPRSSCSLLGQGSLAGIDMSLFYRGAELVKFYL